MRNGIDSRTSWADALGDLAPWLADLRARLAAGALDGLPSVDLGHGTAVLTCAALARTMLADLDHLKALPVGVPARHGRLLALLGDFDRLRLQIG